jgi:helicase
MKINELIQYGFPPALIQSWKQRLGNRLFPIQQEALVQYDLLGDENLLVQAPTSSGKTFIGELAAVHAALNQRKVVYLVPLKSLAKEKFNDFQNAYSAYGVKVLLSTSECRGQDNDFESGQYDIAVTVYEKFHQFLVRRPEKLQEIDIVIADEIEIISDAERGAFVECLLTRLLDSSCRVMGFSAVVGDADKLAEWMRAQLLTWQHRPAELRYGVLFDGSFQFKNAVTGIENEEELTGGGFENTREMVADSIQTFLEKGETCLIFVKSRFEAQSAAINIASRFGAGTFPPALSDAWEGLESTQIKRLLFKTMASGVGFHSADLTADERALVENGCRQGHIQVLIATSTLSAGLNLPIRNVFITSEKWCFDHRFSMPWKTAIPQSEYENMSGRAGRYGLGEPFGRSILVAGSQFEADTLWRTYIEGQREPLVPRLVTGAMEDPMLAVIASGMGNTIDALQEFFLKSLSGQWVWEVFWTEEEIETAIRCSVNRLIDRGLVSEPDGFHYEVTPIGKVVAFKGISVNTAVAMENWLNKAELHRWNPIDLFLMVTSTEDGKTYTVTLTAEEFDSGRYIDFLEEVERQMPHEVKDGNFEQTRSLKISLLVNEWIEIESLEVLEQKFNTYAGQIYAVAEQCSWLIDAASEMARALGAQDDFIQQIATLSQRVKWGLKEEVIGLQYLEIPGISRGVLDALLAHSLHTPQTLTTMSVSALKEWMPESAAYALKSHFDGQALNVAATPSNVMLKLDESLPNTVWMNDGAVQLQEKQFQLLFLLAEHCGKCVSYESIYERLWGELVVESNQIHYQKRKLIERIGEKGPDASSLIKTIPKQGFVLNLHPGQIQIATIPMAYSSDLSN